jgi:hypothetical protein
MQVTITDFREQTGENEDVELHRPSGGGEGSSSGGGGALHSRHGSINHVDEEALHKDPLVQVINQSGSIRLNQARSINQAQSIRLIQAQSGSVKLYQAQLGSIRLN